MRSREGVGSRDVPLKDEPGSVCDRRISINQAPDRANYVTSRRIVRTTPAASGTATQKRTETEICGT